MGWLGDVVVDGDGEARDVDGDGWRTGKGTLKRRVRERR